MFNEMRQEERSLMHWLVGHQDQELTIEHIAYENGISPSEAHSIISRLVGHYGLFEIYGK